MQDYTHPSPTYGNFPRSENWETYKSLYTSWNITHTVCEKLAYHERRGSLSGERNKVWHDCSKSEAKMECFISCFQTWFPKPEEFKLMAFKVKAAHCHLCNFAMLFSCPEECWKMMVGPFPSSPIF